jgi:deoxyribonuclease V
MHLTPLHTWNLAPQEAIALQRQLAAQVDTRSRLDLASIRLIAGVDVSVRDNHSQAAVVILRYPELEVIETVRADQPTPFPYIPGLLSFREGPVLVKAFEQVVNVPDVFIFDGMGIMHPRRLGIASQMGLWLQRPTVGCGKTYFIGQYAEPGPEQGAHSPLTDKGDMIGAVVRTRANVKPVFISPGHLCDLESAVELTLRCTTRYRLPEPIRHAHHAAGVF